MDFTHGGNVYKVSREKNIPIEKIIDFSANINPLGLSEAGNERLKAAWSGVLNYPDPEYVALRGELANFHGCHKDNIYLGNGGIDAIFFLMGNLGIKNAMVVVPTFVEYERALLAAGSTVMPYYLKEETGFQLDVSALMHAAKGHDCIVLCSPNNPTGQLVPKSDIERLLTYCSDETIKLIVDEAFMDFVDYDEQQSCVDYIASYNNLFILRSITKFFAVPGLRLGYVITSNAGFAQAYKQKKEPWCVNHFAQEYTIGALHDETYIQESKKYMIEERRWFYTQLNMVKHINAYKSYGNYVFFSYDGDKQLKEALEDKGILIRSCNNYRGLDGRYFRVAVKKHWENELLLKEMSRICNETSD